MPVLKSVVQAVAVRYLLSRELLSTGAAFNPLDKRYLSDPYPLYRRLREKDPIHQSRLIDDLIFTRYEDVNAILRDNRFAADDRKRPGWMDQRNKALRDVGIDPETAPVRDPSMLRLDPPDHTRLRSLVNRAFTPRAVESFRPRAEAIVNELLDKASATGSMEVIRDLATPLPVIVIAEMLGIPGEDHERFKEWSDAVATQLGFNVSAEQARRAMRAGDELRDYLQGISEERRREPREDLLSALLMAEQEGSKLTLDEVFSTCELLLVAGNETTTNLIGNGLLALLRHPDQLEALRRDPSLMPNAIEEMLRYDSPVQATSRFALEDIEYRGVTIKKDKEVILMIGAANRDPEIARDPETFDVQREEIKHLAFGHGIHFCLGSPLARLEAPIALNALIKRFPDLRLSGEPAWGDNFILHGLKRLPVALS